MQRTVRRILEDAFGAQRRRSAELVLTPVLEVEVLLVAKEMAKAMEVPMVKGMEVATVAMPMPMVKVTVMATEERKDQMFVTKTNQKMSVRKPTVFGVQTKPNVGTLKPNALAKAARTLART